MAEDPKLTPAQLKRRQALKGLLAGSVAAAAPQSLLASNHPVHRHMETGTAVEAADKAVSESEWSPVFLSPQQDETLTALAEHLVPGSNEAGVNRFVDQLLGVDTRDVQARFLSALGAFEAESLRQFDRTFVRLIEAEQSDVLEAAAAAERAHPKGHRDWGWFAIPQASPSREPDLGDALAHVKGWVAGAYYSSEIGMKELGWTGDTFFEGYPGCTHPEGHA
jgi:hypothetical protein